MALKAPPPREMFGGTSTRLTDDQVAERFEQFKSALNDSVDKTARGEFWWHPGSETGYNPKSVIDTAMPELEKALSAEQLSSLKAALETNKAVTADLQKDWTLTNPLSTGYVPFDLEAPAKILVPRQTPVRNMTPRSGGQGVARKFKRITGVSGSGTGGIGALKASINDASTSSWGSLTLRRGPKISYAGDEKSINYKQFGLSDMVNWSAQFAGQGFQDMRQLSNAALLWASFLAEERHLLFSRGTDTGFTGAIGRPVVTAAARTAAAGETGASAGVTLWIKATADGGWNTYGVGESLGSTSAVSQAATTGQVIDVTISTEPSGAVGYKIYASIDATGDPGDGSRFYYGRTGYNKFTINFTGAGTGGAINAGNTIPTADSTASADEYDGYLAYLMDSTQSGYVTRLNAGFSTGNPGSEIETALASLFDSVKADPSDVWANGRDRKQLSDLLKTASSANYRLELTVDEQRNAVLGSMVTGVLNEITGTMLDLTVLPWLPQGVMPIISKQLPVPDSEVTNCWEVHEVQPFMSVAWPVIQHTYDISSYWFNALVAYAPAWSGVIAGIKQI